MSNGYWSAMLSNKTAIVIGGGIAGCSSAYALAQRGIQVTLLERHANLASEASGNPQAMLYPRLSGDDTASQFALMSYLYSLELLKTLELTPADFQLCGMLQLGFNPRELARIEKVAKHFAGENLLRYVNAKEASLLAGLTLSHDAIYFPDAAWVNPQVLCQRLSHHKNISIKTLTNANKILKNKGLFEVYVDQKLVKAADIIIIANANEANNMGLALVSKTQAVRGQVSILKASDISSKLKLIVCSDGYLSPATNGQHCLGATFSTDSTDLTIDELGIDELDHEANLARLKCFSLPLYEHLKDNICAGRVSLRCTSADYFPLVGELLESSAVIAKPPRPNASTATLPWLTGLYINIAHGSRGFTSAPLCAELLASLICGDSLPIPAELAGLLNPNRFLLRKLGLKKLARTLATSNTRGMLQPISS